MLSKGDKANFDTLVRAARNGDVVLLECTDKATGKPVAVVCAVCAVEGEDAAFVPLAKLFIGNPYEELIPP